MVVQVQSGNNPHLKQNLLQRIVNWIQAVFALCANVGLKNVQAATMQKKKN